MAGRRALVRVRVRVRVWVRVRVRVRVSGLGLAEVRHGAVQHLDAMRGAQEDEAVARVVGEDRVHLSWA